jgi:hypothetical protein
MENQNMDKPTTDNQLGSEIRRGQPETAKIDQSQVNTGSIAEHDELDRSQKVMTDEEGQPHRMPSIGKTEVDSDDDVATPAQTNVADITSGNDQTIGQPEQEDNQTQKESA